MKTPAQILQDITADFIALQDKVKYFGKDGAARGIISAISNVLFEIWNDLTQTKRQIFFELSQGADLDTAASRRGLTRKAATKSSVVVLFDGTPTTIIPEGTIIKSAISGISYATTKDIMLGDNPGLLRPVESNVLGDAVIAESVTTGSGSKVGAGELKNLETPITGVTSVINLFPSTGGADTETDAQLKDRLAGQVDILAQGTQAFYEALAKKANADVLRSIATYNPLTGGIDILLVKDSGGQFTTNELLAIQQSVYAGQKALQPVLAKNVTFEGAEIEATIVRNNNYPLDFIFTDIASKLVDLFDFSVLPFGARVKYTDVVKVFLDSKYFDIADINAIKINSSLNDVICGSNSLPKITSLKINEMTSSLTQKYTIA